MQDRFNIRFYTLRLSIPTEQLIGISGLWVKRKTSDPVFTPVTLHFDIYMVHYSIHIESDPFTPLHDEQKYKEQVKEFEDRYNTLRDQITDLLHYNIEP